MIQEKSSDGSKFVVDAQGDKLIRDYLEKENMTNCVTWGGVLQGSVAGPSLFVI